MNYETQLNFQTRSDQKVILLLLLLLLLLYENYRKLRYSFLIKILGTNFCV